MYTQKQTAAEIINHLGLEQHIEGGYFKETHRSNQTIIVNRNGQPSPESAATSIQYLLNKDEQGYSAWHRITDDETWYYQGGQPMLVHYFTDDGKLNTIKLGNPIIDSEAHNQLTVPRNHWFAAEVGADSGYSLVGCAVAPAFAYERFELATEEQLLAEFPQHAAIIKRLVQQSE